MPSLWNSVSPETELKLSGVGPNDSGLKLKVESSSAKLLEGCFGSRTLVSEYLGQCMAIPTCQPYKLVGCKAL